MKDNIFLSLRPVCTLQFLIFQTINSSEMTHVYSSFKTSVLSCKDTNQTSVKDGTIVICYCHTVSPPVNLVTPTY